MITATMTTFCTENELCNGLLWCHLRRISNTGMKKKKKNQFSLVSFASSSNTKTRRRRRTDTVRFNENVQVCEIMSLREYSYQEIRDCWWSRTEYTEFRTESAYVAHILNQIGAYGILLDDIKYSARGCPSKAIISRRHELKHQSKVAVIDEQEQQRQNKDLQVLVEIAGTEKKKTAFRGGRKQRKKDAAGDEIDKIAIATAYTEVSKDAAKEARERASTDAIDARLYCNQNSGDTDDNNDFNDDWITSLSDDEASSSSSSSSSMVSSTNHDDFLDDCTYRFVDESGFDDSWIRDISNMSGILV